MFQPLGDRILVKPKDAEAVTAGGLILPEQSKKRPQEGTVVGMGLSAGHSVGHDGASLAYLSEGDTVVYSQYGGTEIEFDGEELVLLRQSDVLGKRVE